MIVTALNLDVAPSAIEPDAPLYGEGLGLDSIDILEIALEVSKQYGFQLRADDDDNVRIFKSLRSLDRHSGKTRRREKPSSAGRLRVLMAGLALSPMC